MLQSEVFCFIASESLAWRAQEGDREKKNDAAIGAKAVSSLRVRVSGT